MLRLLRPDAPGQGTDPPTRRRGSRSPALTFNAEEVRRIRATLKNAARAFGGADVLAAAIDIPVRHLYAVARRKRPCGMLAIRLATTAGTTVETMLSGQLEAVQSDSRGGAA